MKSHWSQPKYFNSNLTFSRMMTAAHCTSKISAFEDLTTDRLQTFGFRGEALSALCQTSDVEIVTKSANDVVATAITCDKSGAVIKETSVAGNVGTTIRFIWLIANFLDTIFYRSLYYSVNVKKNFLMYLPITVR